MPAKPLAPERQREVRETHARTGSISATATRLDLDRATVRKYVHSDDAADLPALVRHKGGKPRGIPPAKQDEAPADTGADFPAPVRAEFKPFPIDTQGTWLALFDVHVPWHDPETLKLAVAEGKRRGVKGVLLGGDFLDSHEISDHDKDPRAPRYVEEVETGRQLLKWLRGQFPKAEFVYKEGNHEERLTRYVVRRAPALFGLESLDLASLLHLKDIGCEWVGDKRVIELGKLCVLHGHEYAGGGGVNPARWLFTKARYVSMCGHFHRSNSYRDRNVKLAYEAAWSVGCACWLHPKYRPLNSWNNGCAFVEVAADGTFHVDNRAVFNGKLV